MRAKLVYGCPCSGKSTYVRNNAGDNDVIFDYDLILSAVTTKTDHTCDRHSAHYVVLDMRKSLVKSSSDDGNIETFWLIARWPTDYLKSLLEDIETEEVFIEATKEECYERLENDDSRPDKDEWKKIIDDWHSQHGSLDVKNMSKESMSDMSFWSINKNGDGGAEMRIEGEIVDGQGLIDWMMGKPDNSAPVLVQEIRSVNGPLTVWLNSPGGSVFAASAIYTALREHGNVTIKIDGAAMSAASVIAMAGKQVLMSPTSVMMIHNPLTRAEGDIRDMQAAVQRLQEAKSSIISAYANKTGLSADQIDELMDIEKWMSADEAIKLGFADGKLFDSVESSPDISNLMRTAYHSSEITARVSKLDTDALKNSLNTQPDTSRANRLRLAKAQVL